MNYQHRESLTRDAANRELKHWTCGELWSGKLRRLNLQARDLQRVEPGADQFTLRRTRVITRDAVMTRASSPISTTLAGGLFQ